MKKISANCTYRLDFVFAIVPLNWKVKSTLEPSTPLTTSKNQENKKKGDKKKGWWLRMNLFCLSWEKDLSV